MRTFVVYGPETPDGLAQLEAFVEDVARNGLTDVHDWDRQTPSVVVEAHDTDRGLLDLAADTFGCLVEQL